MAVHVSTRSAFAPGGGPGGGGDFGALLKAQHCLHQQWPRLQVIACTNSFIHPLVPLAPWPPLTRLPPLPPAAAGGGSGGGRRGGGGPGGGGDRRVDRTSGVEGALDDLGLWTSDSTRNRLENGLCKVGQRGTQYASQDGPAYRVIFSDGNLKERNESILNRDTMSRHGPLCGRYRMASAGS